MSRTVSEGKVHVYYAASLADKTAPTTAEMLGATDLSGFITKNGVNTPSNQNSVDSGDITSVFDPQVPGSWGGPVNLTMQRDDDDETDAWDLITWGLEGYLIVSRFGAGTTIGDKVEVYPGAFHHPVMSPTAANETQRFTAQFAVSAEPALKATVAAS